MNKLKDVILFQLDFIDFEIAEIEERMKKDIAEFKQFVSESDESTVLRWSSSILSDINADYNQIRTLHDDKRKLVHLLDKAGCL